MTIETTKSAPAAPEPTRRRGGRGGMPWIVAALVLVAAIVPLAILAPEVAVVAVGGTVGLYAAFRWPFVIAFAALASIVGSSIIEAAGGAAAGQVDEALTLLCVIAFTLRRVWIDRAIVVPGGTLWFAGFLIVGAISSLIADVPTEIWLQQAFLSVKGVLLAFAFAQLDWSKRRLRGLVVGGFVLAGVLILTSAINFLAPRAWLDFTGADIGLSPLGVPYLSGPYAHPAALGRICAVIGISCVVYLLMYGARWLPALTLIAVTSIGFLTVRVKTITSMIIVYALFALRSRSTWLVVLVVALLPVAALTIIPTLYLLVSADLTSYFFGEEESARGLLIGGAWQIGIDSFPFGAGFGRYGSYMAAINYSPEYVIRGWTRYYGLGEGLDWGKYLTDTQWPALLGETGWLGTVLFAGGLVAMVASMVRPISASEPKSYTWIRWSGIGWVLLITIESIGAPVFTSPPSYPFTFIGAGIVAALRYQYKRRGLIPLDEY
ncbi:hypothetical protein [Microbacterium pumilum]|uniref:O-antigen ligase domain-containing protein n=1 Tax=Microbacterium pumilum TaxID=344165 RepID=A0ABP5DQ19_9MICO